MTDKHARAGEIMRQMLPPENVASMESDEPNSRFGGEFSRLAYEHAYVAHWTRPGLSPRDRSLLTIGILIGLGNQRELRSHCAAGLRNGITEEQLEEAIYHATAYAGFPMASSALAVASEVVAERRRAEAAKE
jgi:4-carboxymuconolactone decarboxylase